MYDKITVSQNKELQDKLDYLMENQPKTNIETRDTGVECDLPYRYLLFLLVCRKIPPNVLISAVLVNHFSNKLFEWFVERKRALHS